MATSPIKEQILPTDVRRHPQQNVMNKTLSNDNKEKKWWWCPYPPNTDFVTPRDLAPTYSYFSLILFPTAYVELS